METINIIAVDDHEIVLDGIEYALSSEENINLIARAQSKKELIDKLIHLHEYIHIIILDLNLNDNSGDYISLINQLQNKYPKIKILVLTTYTGSTLISNLKQAGVKGYLSKNHSKADLIQAIQRISENNDFFPVSEDNKPDIKLEDRFELKTKLSEREKEVLNLIGIGKTDKEIAEKLSLSSKTIKTHRQNIRKKFNVNSTVELVGKIKGS